MNSAYVHDLFITKDDDIKTRLRVESIVVDNEGILGDKFYGKNLQRSVLITSLESYTMAQKEGITLEYGLLGENILIDINPYHLCAGAQLKIGDALLEITQNCTLCKGLTSVHSKLPKLLKDDRGIFAKVINGKHTIYKGDSVVIL